MGDEAIIQAAEMVTQAIWDLGLMIACGLLAIVFALWARGG